jgi:hypothetical protein
LSVEHVMGKEYTFDVNFPEDGLNYRIDFNGETLRVNYLAAGCEPFSYKDLLTYPFNLGKHDIFIVFCQPSEDAKETVKFIIDGKPVYYEVPGELTVWLEDSGEVASLHTGDDPGELTITPKEAFILAASNTKHNQKLTDSRKKTPLKSGIPVPEQMLVEKEAGKLTISWPWYESIFRKDIIMGLILVLFGIAAGIVIFRYISDYGLLLAIPGFSILYGYWMLEHIFVKNKIVIVDKELEARSGITMSKKVVRLDEVEKFELHKGSDERNNPTGSQVCALMKSGKHQMISSSGSAEVLAYLESELNLVLHRSEKRQSQ